jgi:cation diffusion facilitator CzcD-associated flavoprotein CzcO
MASTSNDASGGHHPAALQALAAAVRRDFERLLFPAANWVPTTAGPNGRPALDVLVIGGGMCGQTAAFALARDGVRNVRVIDRAASGREGPWGTYARMDTLRSPKHLTGPDLGFPALTFRAWYEARHGTEGWQRLTKVATSDWLAYLLWVRDTVPIAVENGVEATLIELDGEFVRVQLAGPGGAETVYARKVVLAGGRDGFGAPYAPPFTSLESVPHSARARIFHASDSIDFARFKGGSVGVLGASASAFDNAAVALEAGARDVRLFSRRPHLPQVNKSKWTVFPGFFHGYADLEDARRWRIYTYIFGEGVPPPHESVLRCERHAGFAMHFAEPWVDVVPAVDGVTVVTPKARYRFDAAIFATGFSVDLSQRPELARLRDQIALWADRIAPAQASHHPEAARFPYLGPGFELVARAAGSAPGLGNIHCFNAGSTLSQAAVAGDIPGLAFGANRLSRAIASSLLAASIGPLESALHAYDDRELEPTRHFLPR